MVFRSFFVGSLACNSANAILMASSWARVSSQNATQHSNSELSKCKWKVFDISPSSSAQGANLAS